MKTLDEIGEALDETLAIIDGEMNCHTPEYRAINSLYLIVSYLHAHLANRSECPAPQPAPGGAVA